MALNKEESLEIETLGFINSAIFQSSNYELPDRVVAFFYGDAMDHNYQPYLVFRAVIRDGDKLPDSIFWDSKMVGPSLDELSKYKDDAEKRLMEELDCKGCSDPQCKDCSFDY